MARSALLVLIPMLGGGIAHAQGLDLTGHWYIQGGGGVNWVPDTEFTNGDLVIGDIAWETGWLAGGAIGYAFDNGFRFEAEGVYRTNDYETYISSILNSVADPQGYGEATAIGIMANLLYDIDTGSALTPYLGGGVGAGNVEYVLGGGSGTFLAVDTWGVALQAIAGASYAVTDTVDVFADYRYFTVLDSAQSAVFSPVYEPGLDDYVAHSVFFGARYHFLPPPPPPPPPAVEPPPPPAQDRFIVFFDWDRSNLTAQANGVLDQAVATYNQAGFAQVLAEGHADRSGPAGYNVGLSQRRGESVRQGLIARGIAPDEIVVRAFGETQLLVPTPDGVREPQNRRVEIILM
ncbi:MAG: OmpA family protein [Azospirillaceae bacterium]